MIQVLSTELKELYMRYGIAVVQLEIAQSRANEAKVKLRAVLNKKPVPEVKKDA